MLQINNLSANIADKQILKDLSLEVKDGEVHAIMGPNGSGKSTLANVLAGNTDFVIDGSINFNKDSLLELDTHERALAGLFMAFQHPVVIPGLATMTMIKAALDAKAKHLGQPPSDVYDIMAAAKTALGMLMLDEAFLKRGVNEGLSGGERKRLDMLQMMMLEPKLCILDEIDSGLDIDSLQTVAKVVNNMRCSKRSFILITHYNRLLHYIKPDVVHVLIDGKIVKTGDAELAKKIEQEGYGWLGGK